MAQPTRWVTETKDGHSQWYIDRFRTMAAAGEDLAGEARLVDAMLPRQATVLDAGCGTGRIGAELHTRGHTVIGVDADPALIEAARADYPGPRWETVDLAELDLAALDLDEPFDAAVVAGNVMVFLAPGTETEVLARLRASVRSEGFVVTGFHTNRHLSLAQFDRCVAEAGLVVEQRFATWDLKPWHPESDWAVSVLRRGPEGT
ncbi:class I SAM-dependent methyltransferase [Phytoactinopolyspora alkaliphila]|uniref:Class I SAM-dependent methyltransferase n=1 Tax=Phytoactinopolyspora alkaliphila TaxID=1783498 RepID=A0A6N9YSN2_9ACTN|nr:class I SAM-dependent methyltransferase [Phytoactinopolyspora alkaliphila]NED98053.1 class I SAM-dependent methyltransferase [Phytoactinopolyspora alkaliphila]